MKKLLLISLIFFVVYNVVIDKPTQNKIDKFEEEVRNYVEEDNSVVNDTDVVSGGGTNQKERSPEVIEYFNDITLNSEFDESRETAFKWTRDMKIYVDGKKPEYLMSELSRVVGELNDIINTINIKVVSSLNQANYIIYFGSHTDFKGKYDLGNPQHLESNWGYFETYSYSGLMYVDLVRNGDETSHKHLLREELTQSLGLFNDSWDYPESIFYQGWTTTTEYAPIDRELIDMLYNN